MVRNAGIVHRIFKQYALKWFHNHESFRRRSRVRTENTQLTRLLTSARVIIRPPPCGLVRAIMPGATGNEKTLHSEPIDVEQGVARKTQWGSRDEGVVNRRRCNEQLETIVVDGGFGGHRRS